MKKQNGFTLVELAIVLMIIGLLIGGVLRGQEMMNNARLQGIVKQVTSYTAAYNSFMDTYAAKPGDMLQATNRIPGCTVQNTCMNGNGDGSVGAQTLIWTAGNTSMFSENIQFWKHLALAHLITGVNPSASSLAWGTSHPQAAFGGFTIVTAADPGDPSVNINKGSLIIRLHNGITDPVIENNPAVSPKQAAYIDQKMDDGMPRTGDVQSTAAGSQPACDTAYDTTVEKSLCVMSFLLNR